MTKEESLYQVKLILDNIPEDEYKKIPEKMLNYINENMKYNKNISINTNIPLEDQDIDEKTYIVLNKIINEVEFAEQNDEENKREETKLDNQEHTKIIEMLDKLKKENEELNLKLDNYKNEIDSKNNELNTYKMELDKLRNTNQELYGSIQKCPKIFRKLFFKDIEKKLLK